jgi:V/A-type H+-transporting ATPase subunit E
MNKIEEKFSKFSHMVMKEADARKKEIISEAEKLRSQTISENENVFLKNAYDKIRDSMLKVEKEHNEEISKAILSGKQALFYRREEILKSVFTNVKNKLADFKQSDDYKSFMIETILKGLEKAGQGEIQVNADSEDIPLIEEIRAKTGAIFELTVSEEHLMGGCRIRNKTKGFLLDFSFTKSLSDEKAAFLENYGLSIG